MNSFAWNNIQIDSQPNGEKRRETESWSNIVNIIQNYFKPRPKLWTKTPFIPYSIFMICNSSIFQLPLLSISSLILLYKKRKKEWEEEIETLMLLMTWSIRQFDHLFMSFSSSFVNEKLSTFAIVFHLLYLQCDTNDQLIRWKYSSNRLKYSVAAKSLMNDLRTEICFRFYWEFQLNFNEVSQ